MANPEVVSVIIPTFNYARFLPACIQSVLLQRDVRIEVVVVDDGSEDETPELLRSFGNKLKVIRQENRGLSAARNCGIEHASGSHLVFLDSDDLLAKDSIALRLRALKDTPDCQIVACKNSTFSRLTYADRPVPNGLWPMYRTHLDLHLCHFNIAPPHAFLMTRELVEAVGKFDESLSACEDYDYWLRCMSKLYVPGFAPGKVYYRRHSASMSANRLNQVKHDAIIHKRVFSRFFDGTGTPVSRSSEGLLAFASGLLRTINRLNNLNSSERQIAELWEIYLQIFPYTSEFPTLDFYEQLLPEGKYYFQLHIQLLRFLSNRLDFPSGVKSLDYENQLSLNLFRESLRSLYQNLHRGFDPGLRWRVAKFCLQLSMRQHPN